MITTLLCRGSLILELNTNCCWQRMY